MGDVAYICQDCKRARAVVRVSHPETMQRASRSYKLCRKCLLGTDGEGVVSAL